MNDGALEEVGVVVANEDGRRARIAEDRRHRLHAVLAVDHVGLEGERAEVAARADRHAGGGELVGDDAGARGVHRRLVTVAQELEREVAHVQLRAGALAQRMIGQQDPQRGRAVSWHGAEAGQ